MTKIGQQWLLQLQKSGYMRHNVTILGSTFLRYYATCATCALFKYTEHRLNARYAPGSLLIRYVQVDGTMMINTQTTRNLELVSNARYKKSSHSLFGCVSATSRCHYEVPDERPRTINRTFTAMAARLLRMSILAPVTGERPSR
jgi:DNA mismatch repair protein MSH4